jgi:hypothetical protein
VEIIFLQVGFHGRIFRHFFVMIRVPFHLFLNSYSLLT